MKLPVPHQAVARPGASGRYAGRLLASAIFAAVDSSSAGNPSSVADPAAYQPGAQVYALGTLSYDFSSRANHTYFVQHLAHENPDVPFVRSELLAYLDQNPRDAERLLWTLNVDDVPIGVLLPENTFGRETYALFRQLLSFLPESDTLLSVPGVVDGQTMLLSGQIVPTIRPVLAGIYSWAAMPTRIETISDGVVDEGEREAIVDHIGRFQARVYDELRNTGRARAERAANYAATQAFQYLQNLALDYVEKKARLQAAGRQAEGVVPINTAAVASEADQALQDARKLTLTNITVEASPICRPVTGSDCWDVRLKLFDPAEPQQKAKQVYKFTVDVGDRLPVMITEMDQWEAE